MRKEDLFYIIGEADEHKVAAAGDAMSKKEKPRSFWVKWGALAACLCLVAAGAFVIPKLHDIPSKTNIIVVNDGNLFLMDIDAQISFYNFSPIEEEVALKFEEITGLSYDDFVEKIPDAYRLESLYSIDTPVYVDGKNEYAPHDFVLNYQYEGGENGKVQIAICQDEVPLRDLYYSSHNPQPSEINGVKVYIHSLDYIFMAAFTYEDINYEIETNNITLEELENLLVEIIS